MHSSSSHHLTEKRKKPEVLRGALRYSWTELNVYLFIVKRTTTHGFDDVSANELAHYSSRCAEYATKSLLLRFGFIPDKKHDVRSLSNQIKDDADITDQLRNHCIALINSTNDSSKMDQQGMYFTGPKGDLAKATDCSFRTRNNVAMMGFIYDDVKNNKNVTPLQRSFFMQPFSRNRVNLKQMNENYLRSIGDEVEDSTFMGDRWKEHTLATLDHLIPMHHSILNDFEKFNRRRKRHDKNTGQHI